MKERERLARLWMAVLALALVVGPGLIPAGAAELVRDGPARITQSTTTGGGATDIPDNPSTGIVATGGPSPGAGVPPGTDAGWWATVQEDIRQSEYHVTWQERTYLAHLPAAYQAPNRAHNLRTYFTPEGVSVIPRAFEGETPPWEWSLTLTGYGYAGAVQPVSAASLHSEGNHIEYRRDLLVEWYVNDEQGLEQGFTLDAPPQPAGAGSLVLELALGGDLSPQLTADGTAVEFVTAGGVRVLHYGELVIVDADGRHLPADLELTLHALRIRFDTSGARYPITVDPLTTSLAWTAESNQDSAQFGFSVGTAGDVNGDGYSDLVVGAYLYDNGQVDEGRACVYLGSAAGLTTSPTWTAEANQAIARFGWSVGTAGDVNGDGYSDLVVGSSTYSNGHAYEGAAFVYLGSATGLSGSAAWSAEGDQDGAQFGNAVGTAGDVNGDGYSDLVVGAALYDNGQTDEGRTYVYLGSAAGLTAFPPWMAEGDQDDARFGYSVGTAGDVNGDGYSDLIAGAPRFDNGEMEEGRAYVYLGSAGGLGALPAWTAEGDQDGANFGSAVAMAGDVNGDGYSDLVVGAPLYDSGQTDEGRAHVYHGGAGGPSAGPAWTAESDQDSAWFGWSVGTAGDVNGDGCSDVIAGALGYSNGEAGEGRAYVYHGSGGGLGISPSWTAEGNQDDARFGYSVGTAGDVDGDGYSDTIVGAPFYDNGETNEGRAYVFHGGSAGLGTTADWSAESNQDVAQFGRSLGTAGDVDGDGYSDVIVGAWMYDDGEADEGCAYVYLGSASGLSISPAWTAEGNQDGAQFGTSVAMAGDVNGDGYADVLVGAPLYDNGEQDEGRAFVFLGGATGLDISPAWTAESDQPYAYFGTSVGTAGDVNDDSYSDVIVGANTYDNGQTDEGRAYVYLGGAAGLSASPAWAAESNQHGAQFGSSLGTAGDVNGDGYGDVIVGAWLYDNGETNEGRAFVYHGNAGGLSASPAWMAECNQGGAFFGISVDTAGDVNGDGYSDVIVGALRYDNGQTDEGRAYVYSGGDGGLNTIPTWTGEGNQDDAGFGASVDMAGDVNGDGYSDVIVGAPGYSYGEAHEGRAYTFLGGVGGLGGSSAWMAEGNQDYARFGEAVGTAGDVNGDGYSDLVVGASGYSNGQTYEGAAFVYLGSATGPTISPTWTAESDQDDAWFGQSVGTAGDVNGDGYSDVIVGAYLYDNGQKDQGRAYVYPGSAAGLNAGPIWTAEGNQDDAYFGRSVGTAGDVNGDGYSDVVVGADGYSNGEIAEGQASVYLGSPGGLTANPIWTAEGNRDGARLGWSVGTAGDVNGDGDSDLIVGAPSFGAAGWVVVYHGGEGGLGTTPSWTVESSQSDTQFGVSVGTAGDVDGDGYSDVIAGAPFYDYNQEDEGAAYVYHGGATGLGANPAWTAEGDQAGALFGASVGTAGDVDGDGYSDVVAGAYHYDNGQMGEGRAYVYAGSASGLATAPDWIAESNQVDAFFGISVGTAGDVNGDGYSDLIVGAHLYDNRQMDEGRVYVYLSQGSDGLGTHPAWTAEGDQDKDSFGTVVGTAGDVNGDGYADILVGAPRYDNGQADEGRAFLYYGNGGAGLHVLPGQLRSDGSAPIAHLGLSDDPTAFRASLIGRMPLGRAGVKLQWQVAPLGVPFNDPSVVEGSSPAWIDTGTGSTPINQIITGLTPGTPYYWRVRLIYRPGNALGQAASRWIHIPWAGWHETDLRTLARREVYLPCVVKNH
jgi:hypothetical protein